MATRYADRYAADTFPGGELTLALWNEIMLDIDLRISQTEGQVPAVQRLIDSTQELVLSRLQETINPAIAQIQEAATLGFLIAGSTTSATLGAGNIITFILSPGAQRELFQPSAFVNVTRLSSPDDYAVARVMGFVRERGELQVEIIQRWGAVGPFTDWQVSASPGVVPSIIELLNQVRGYDAVFRAYRDAAGESRDFALTYSNNANTAAGQANTHRANALTYLNDLKARYLGPLSADPAGPHVVGRMYFHTGEGVLRVYDGQTYAPAVSASIGGVRSIDYVATAGQTVFAVPGGSTSLDVYLEGVILRPTIDYTVASGGVSVTLTEGAAANDFVQLRGYRTNDASEFATKAELTAKADKVNATLTNAKASATLDPGVNDLSLADAQYVTNAVSLAVRRAFFFARTR